jgi:hypothetical protein
MLGYSAPSGARPSLTSDSSGASGVAVVGGFLRVGVGDVAADGGDDVGAGVDHALQHLDHLRRLRLGGRVDAHQAGHLGVVGTEAQRERAAHAEADHDDLARRAAASN